MMDNIVLAQYGTPTPIQSYTIPAILADKDVLAIAQTGTCPPWTYHRCMLTPIFRLRQDRRISHPYRVEVDGQSQEAQGSSP